MTEPQAALSAMLNRVRRRVQRRDALRMLWLALSLGLALTALLLVAARLWPWLTNQQVLLVGLGLVAFGLMLGQVFAWLKPISWQKLAQIGDQALRLDERLTTALALTEGRLTSLPAIKTAQLNDTIARWRGVSVAAALPLLPARWWVWAVVPALLLQLNAVLVLAPNPQEDVLAQRQELSEMLAEEIAALEQLQAELETGAQSLPAEDVAVLSQTIQNLLSRLEAAQIEASPEAALAALTEAEDTLATLNQAEQQRRQSAETALQSLADSLTSSDSPAAQDAATALQQAAEALQANEPGAETAVTEALQQAAQAMQEMAQSGQTTPENAAAMSQALSQAAQSLGSDAPTAEALQQAAQQMSAAAQSGDAQSAQQGMQQAAEALQQAAQSLGEQAAGQQALSEQMQQALNNIQQAQQQLASQGEGSGEGRAEAQLEAGQGEGNTGQGQGAGNGSGRGDPGDGAEGLHAVDGTDGLIDTDNGPNEHKEDIYWSVYAPEHAGGSGGDFMTPDDLNPDGSGIDIGETGPNPNRPPGQPTQFIGEKINANYRDAVNQIERGYIPLDSSDYIRQYFLAIDGQ